eukprot:GAHX01000311.1.p1 GENE.GAHX01000311.1~~GAHX01000311.1.p1  ORF type:complete len:632 (-),score=146.34 GAHX01000311.1:28-1875(-)
MEKIVEKVAELTSVLNKFSTKTKISLPRIAVVGQQSSGKSSVLEGIIGMDILPRASGLCTRVPLILSIINDKRIKNNIVGNFAHLNKDQNRSFQTTDKMRNAEAIRQEVLKRTNELTKPGELKNAPITLTIYSADFPNLNLVDLPGLTKISTAGQSASVVRDIESMVRDFISSDSTIILAVVPANSDLANSDALGIAQEYDPHGLRTLGIVTKLDLMDKGTSAIKVLNNKEFFLKLGYVGVISRGQMDLEKKTSVDEANRKADQFFSMHADYSEIADRCGFSFLKSRLGEVFSKHVTSMLPKLHTELTKLQEDKAAELKALGGEDTTPEEKLAKAIAHFVRVIENYISGKVPKKYNTNLFGGAKLKKITHEEVEKELLDIHQYDNENEISQLNLKSMGVDSSLLFGEKVFNSIVTQEIKKLEPPMKKGVFQLILCLSNLIDLALQDSKVNQYPNLKAQINTRLKSTLSNFKKKTDSRIIHKIYIESNHINSDHPEFYSLPLEAFQHANDKISKNMPHHERSLQIQTLVTTKLVSSYVDIVKRGCLDYFIKITQKELVSSMQNDIKDNLFLWAIKRKDAAKLVEENPALISKRRMLDEELASIRKGVQILNGISFN